jgi:hypothetical protein
VKDAETSIGFNKEKILEVDELTRDNKVTLTASIENNEERIVRLEAATITQN